MQTKTDAELLSEYAAKQSEAAFSEIVRRYADAVYSSALRQAGNDAHARDVAQTVFVDLARKAASLNANTLLIGWLHRGARLAALELLRKEHRRQNRERQAMELFDPASDVSNDWNVVHPVLDKAIANLGHEDRDALLLRFFKNENLASIGATLGVSEDAAQKRVSRALGKLRDFLEQRGIKTTAATLSAALAANAVQSAPAGFAASLATAALVKAAVDGGSAAPLLKLFTLTNMKTAALIVALAGSLAALTVVKIKSENQLRAAQTLTQKQMDEIEGLRAINERLAAQTNDLAGLRSEALETLRLRAEVTRLRRDLVAQKALASTASKSEIKSQPDPAEFQQINIRAKFISVPASQAPGDLNGMLTDSNVRMILETLKKTDGVNFLGEGGIVTLNRRQSQLQISGDSAQGRISKIEGVILARK